MPPQPTPERALGPLFRFMRWIPMLVLVVYALGILRHVELPGLYMDAVNPDYLAARTLNRELPNPVFAMPTATFPILGNLYHGVQNYYVTLPVIGLLGSSVVSIRLSQALFGALLVFFLYRVLVNLTQRRILAGIAALALATDVAFLASFRTQNYIILGGEAWMFVSLYFLTRPAERLEKRLKNVLLSGIFFGLAVYGYFVFLFFLPVMLLVALRAEPQSGKRAALRWTAGFVIGMQTYVAGYLSLVLSMGGIGPAMEWLRTTILGLNPLSSQLSLWQGVEYAVEKAQFAMLNMGNEHMLFQEVSDHRLAVWRLGIQVLLILAGLAMLLRPRTWRLESTGHRFLFLLPIAYLGCGVLLGSRLNAHHYSVMVAMAYLLSFLALAQFADWLKARFPAKFTLAAFAITCAAVLAVNVKEQGVFFERLVQTGGVGRTSSALTTLAEEALSEGGQTGYIFPEWGFFMSFALLTGNTVPYELAVTPEAIARLKLTSGTVKLAFWNDADEEKYRLALSQLGISQLDKRRFVQRDGKPAFFLLSGRLN